MLSSAEISNYLLPKKDLKSNSKIWTEMLWNILFNLYDYLKKYRMDNTLDHLKSDKWI